MNKYKVVLLGKSIYNEIIEADYILVKENSGVTVFFHRKYQYNDIEDTIVATAPPTAFIIQINDEL